MCWSDVISEKNGNFTAHNAITMLTAVKPQILSIIIVLAYNFWFFIERRERERERERERADTDAHVRRYPATQTVHTQASKLFFRMVFKSLCILRHLILGLGTGESQ